VLDQKLIPPHDVEAEKAFLCCIMTDSDALIKSGVTMQEHYFYNKALKIVFKATQALTAINATVDLVSLKNQLNKTGKLSEVGGIPGLMEIMGTVSTSANVKHYAEIIIEKYKLRLVIQNATTAIESAYNLEDADSVIGTLNTSIIHNNAEKSTEPVSLADYLPQYNSEQSAKQEKQSFGISTGWESLDEAIGGFSGGQLIVVAGRPAMGKSQFALQLGVNTARQKVPAGVISMEMGKPELTSRVISTRTGILYDHIRKPFKQTKEDRSKLAHYGDQIRELGKYLFLDDTNNLTISSLIMKIRLLVHSHKCKVIFVDYIGLVDLQMQKGERDTVAIGRLTRSLKVLAKELLIDIVILSQLNRDVEKRPDKRPILSDLRESGNIEQDVDIAILLYREYYYFKKEVNDDGEYVAKRAEIIIAKQRNGAAQTVFFDWDGQTVTFSDRARESVTQPKFEF